MKYNLPVLDRETVVPPGLVLVSRTNLKGVIIYANDAFVSVSGFTREELLNQPHNIVRHPDTPPMLFSDMWYTLHKGEPWRGTLKNRSKDGAFYWVDTCVVPVRQHDCTIGYMSVRQAASPDAIAAARRLMSGEDTPATGWQQRMAHRIGIRRGIELGTRFVTAAMLAGGILGIGGLLLANRTGDILTRQYVEPLQVSARLGRTLADIQRNLQGLRHDLSYEEPLSQAERRQTAFAQSGQSMQADLQLLSDRLQDTTTRERLQDLQKTLTSLQREGLLPVSEALANQSASQLQFLLSNKLLPLAEQAERELEVLENRLGATALEENRTASQRNHLIQLLAILGIGMCILAVVRVGRLYLSHIIDPLNDAIGRLDRIAQGHLAGDICLEGAGETGRLNRASTTMQLHLRVMLDEISQRSRHMDTQCLRLKDLLWQVVEHAEQQHDHVGRTGTVLLQIADEISVMSSGLLHARNTAPLAADNLHPTLEQAQQHAAEAEAQVRDIAGQIATSRTAVQNAWRASELLEHTSRELRRLVSRFELTDAQWHHRPLLTQPASLDV